MDESVQNRLLGNLLAAIVLATLAVYGGFILPMAVAAYRHLYADGAAFNLRALTGSIAFGIRVLHHVLTQGPIVMLRRLGCHDADALSLLYGGLLFYLPFILIAAANIILLRIHRVTEAALLTISYCLMLAYAGFFIVSESHLAASAFLFSLTIAIYVKPCKPRTIALIVVAILACACYETWAFFGLMMFIVLFRQDRGLAYAYLFTAIANGMLIVHPLNPPLAAQRNDMILNHPPLSNLWCPKPWYAYGLRIMNLIIPILCSLFMMIARKSSMPKLKLLFCAVLPCAALFSIANQVTTTLQWNAFIHQMQELSNTRARTVDVNSVPHSQLDKRFLWGWTVPYLSVSLQYIDNRPRKNIVVVENLPVRNARLRKELDKLLQ